MYLNQPTPDFNTVEPDKPAAKDGGATPRREFARLGVELHHRGPRPVAEFVSELADLAPDLAEEIKTRLEAYTNIPAETYQALGADRFTPFMVSMAGGRK